MAKATLLTTVAAATILGGSFACDAGGEQDLARAAGSVRIDGSSTVYPVTAAVAEEFAEVAPRVRVTVGISGTGGGFKRFVAGETDLSNASRPIKPKEYAAAVENGIEFIELPVAYDGLSVVVNPENSWVDRLTIEQVREIFLADRAAKTWNEINPAWPNQPIKIYAPGTDSGTFDYFKEVVAGDEGAIRSDMSVSEDDNVLVRGVSGDPNAIGFFGYAYYEENRDRLKIVPIVNPASDEAVTPTPETIETGEYAPFSRPLFVYVREESVARPEVDAFVKFYLDHAAELAQEVGYVQLPERLYDVARRRYAERVNGTVFVDENGEKVEGSLTQLFR